jgi:hypothetical protein
MISNGWLLLLLLLLREPCQRATTKHNILHAVSAKQCACVQVSTFSSIAARQVPD